MKFTICVLFVGLAIAPFVLGADEFKCHQCMRKTCAELDSTTLGICKDPEVPEGRADEPWYCYTLNEGNEETEIRDCTRDKDFCKQLKNCDICDESECNSSASVMASVVLVALSAMLVKFTY